MADGEDQDKMVRVKQDTWERLFYRKGPGDSYDDVINDLLDIVEELEEDAEE